MEIDDFIYKLLRYVRAKLLWQNKKHFRNLSNLLLSILNNKTKLLTINI